MLREITNVRQDDPHTRRRWFQDDYFDLFLWERLDGEIRGFQLCYEINANERVLSWRHTAGFSHDRIDTGEATPYKNMTPILVADGKLEVDEVLPRFLRRSRNIEPFVRQFVSHKLREYESTVARSGTSDGRSRALTRRAPRRGKPTNEI